MSICLSRYAIQESKKIPIIVHPLKTSSCGMFWGLFSFSIVTTSDRHSCPQTPTRVECFLVAQLLENILGRAKRQSRNRTCASCFLVAQLLENIPHEEVFRGMQILWINIESRIAERNLRNEIRNAVWAKRVHWVIWRICVPASELRTFSRSFFCFGFLSGDRKKMKIRLCPAKNAKNYR